MAPSRASTADFTGFEVVGDKELIAKLEKLSKSTSKKAIRKGSRAGAKLVTKRAKALAPVSGTRLKTSKGNKTTRRTVRGQRRGGALKRAVKTRALKRSRKFIGVTTTIGKGFFKGDTFYAGFVEFGWKTGARKSTPGAASRREVPGQHFMLRAAQQEGRRALSMATRIIKREIEQAAKISG